MMKAKKKVKKKVSRLVSGNKLDRDWLKDLVKEVLSVSSRLIDENQKLREQLRDADITNKLLDDIRDIRTEWESRSDSN